MQINSTGFINNTHIQRSFNRSTVLLLLTAAVSEAAEQNRTISHMPTLDPTVIPTLDGDTEIDRRDVVLIIGLTCFAGLVVCLIYGTICKVGCKVRQNARINSELSSHDINNIQEPTSEQNVGDVENGRLPVIAVRMTGIEGHLPRAIICDGISHDPNLPQAVCLD